MSEYFKGMTDPRQEAKVKHSFIETIMIVICAVMKSTEQACNAGLSAL